MVWCPQCRTTVVSGAQSTTHRNKQRRYRRVHCTGQVRPRASHCVPFQGQLPVVRMSRVYAGFPGHLCITMILAEPSGFRGDRELSAEHADVLVSRVGVGFEHE